MSEDIKKKVKDLLTDYLRKQKYRKTPERFAILDTVYSIEGHFDIERLYTLMEEERRFRVSKATLYNTIQLFIHAGLVIKHQFGGTSQYERSYNNETHHHMICTSCGKVSEFEDTQIRVAVGKAKLRAFTASHYSLYIYGVCNKCNNAKNKRKKAKVEVLEDGTRRMKRIKTKTTKHES